MFYVGVAVLVAAIALTYAQLPPRTVGRYVVAQANGDFANVVWVLDTLTGEVAAIGLREARTRRVSLRAGSSSMMYLTLK